MANTLDDFFAPDETAMPAPVNEDTHDFDGFPLDPEEARRRLNLSDEEQARLDFANYLISTGRFLQ